MDWEIVDGADQIDLQEVMRLLGMTYWANKRSPDTVARSMRNSDCYGVYVRGEKKLAGFARVLSDHATTYYLCDVIVDPAYRHQGLGKALVSHIVSRPEYAGLRGLLLTRDAHGLYAHFGFENAGSRAMVRPPDF